MCSFITTLWLASFGRWEGYAANWHGCPSTAAEQALCLLKRLAIVTHVTINDCSWAAVNSEFLQPCCRSSRWRVQGPESRWDCQALLLSTLLGQCPSLIVVFQVFQETLRFSFVCFLFIFLMNGTSSGLNIFYLAIEVLSGRETDTCSPSSFPGMGADGPLALALSAVPGSGSDGDDLSVKSVPRNHTEAPSAFAKKFSLASPGPSTRDAGSRHLLKSLLSLKALPSPFRGRQIHRIWAGLLASVE